MDPICKEFTHKTGIPCQLILGSSGKLATQSQQGAPYDIFIAADTSYTNFLFKKGATLTTPKTFAFGKLVVWTSSEITGLSDIIKNKKLKIAIANPKTAPYGQRSIVVLKKLGLLKNIKNQFVVGGSVGQTNQFIESGVVAGAMTAQSACFETGLGSQGIWTAVDSNLYQPIPQSIVQLKSMNHNTVNTQKFVDFLFSKDATTILNKFGYYTVL